jgi:hypothetical protein
MSISSAHAASFFDEIIREGQVWTIRDSEGIPAPYGSDGKRAMPFWSLASRAETVINSVSAYAEFTTVAIPLIEWRSRWIEGLERDGLLVGLNWSGARATGFDVEPRAALAALVARE